MSEAEMDRFWHKLEDILVRLGSLDTKVGLHITSSEQNAAVLRSEIHSVKGSVAVISGDMEKLYSSMPKDAQGNPSLYKHESHHIIIEGEEDDRRGSSQERRAIKKSFLESAAGMFGKIIVALAVLVVLGEKAGAVAKLIGG